MSKKVLDLTPKLAAKKSNSMYDIEAALNIIEDRTPRGEAIRKANEEHEKSNVQDHGDDSAVREDPEG